MRFLRSTLAGSALLVLSAVAWAAPAPQGCELGTCVSRPIAQERIQVAVKAACKAEYDRYRRCLQSCPKKGTPGSEQCAGRCQSPWEDCENRSR